MFGNQAVLFELQQVTREIRELLVGGYAQQAALLVTEQCSSLQRLNLTELSPDDKGRLENVAIQVVEQQRMFRNASAICDQLYKSMIGSGRFSVTG